VSLRGDAVKVLLSAPTIAKTAHFVLQAAPAKPVSQELPTAVAPDKTESVDNSVSSSPCTQRPIALALVVPKRYAKRATTRNLVKRQMREAVRRCCTDWYGRDLLIRQRSAFISSQFRSAASDALRLAVRGELDRLFEQARQR
jgi:ribonuclease P protein component